MKIKAKLVSSIILLIAALAATTTSVLGWFAKNDTVNNDITKAQVIKQYFHTGEGTEEKPFVITRPIHYYNLVQLYQRKDGFAEAGYHFQLGYDLDKSGDGVLEVYNYGNDGKIATNTSGDEYNGTNYAKVLNMKFYSGENALLPIGTSDVPFIATFDGSGLIIENLGSI